MKILITAAQGDTFRRYFPMHVLDELRKLGEVELNPFPRRMSREELMERIGDVDVLITHWGTPQVDEEMLAHAPKLRLLAHAAGTVAHIASEACYERGIPVLSANAVMARYVAEAAVGYLICACRRSVQMDSQLKNGQWVRYYDEQKSLFDREIGLIGLGTVGRELLTLLAPFGCRVHVYDPYLSDDALAPWPNAQRADFHTAMSRSIVSVHAAQTPETFHIINADALALMPDGGTLINTARGSLVDSDALARELAAGRLYAMIDVYENEGDPRAADVFRAYPDRVFLQPHVAALPAQWQMTEAIVEDLKRFQKGEAMKLTVPLSQYRLMTQE